MIIATKRVNGFLIKKIQERYLNNYRYDSDYMCFKVDDKTFKQYLKNANNNLKIAFNRYRFDKQKIELL